MQTRRRQIIWLLVVAVLLIVFGGTPFAQSDPILGTWSLNVARSKFDPGPTPMNETMVTETWETEGIKVTFIFVTSDGTRASGGFAAHYDGKDYKITAPEADTIALKRLHVNTITSTGKKGGKVVMTSNIVVSRKGKILTLTSTGMNAKAQKVHNVEVFDRQ
jgi:hypothetical protein